MLTGLLSTKRVCAVLEHRSSITSAQIDLAHMSPHQETVNQIRNNQWGPLLPVHLGEIGFKYRNKVTGPSQGDWDCLLDRVEEDTEFPDFVIVYIFVVDRLPGAGRV